jgi:hypothetical protein
LSFSNTGIAISGLPAKADFFKAIGLISSNYSTSSNSISSSSSALTSASKKSTLSISILKSNIAHTSSLHLNPKIYKIKIKKYQLGSSQVLLVLKLPFRNMELICPHLNHDRRK